MAYDKAGFYQEALIDENGYPFPNTAITIYQAGTTTLATVYTDRNKTSTVASPKTDSLGNIGVYLQPGFYDLVVSDITVRVEVEPDSSELESDLIDVKNELQDAIDDKADITYVDAQIASVTTVDTDVFAKRNENNNMSGFKFTNVKTQGITIAATTYSLQEADSGSILRFTANSAITVTCPNNLPIECLFVVVQKGTGVITFSPASGATLSHRQNHTKTAGQNAAVSLYIDTNSGTNADYLYWGDTAA